MSNRRIFYTCLFFVVFVFAGHIQGQDVSPINKNTDQIRLNEVDTFINVRGISMHYAIYGEGDPLLLLHGNGGCIHDFSNQIPYFSQRFKVIAVDSRAQGESVDTTDSLSYEMMADDFNGLLDSLHLNNCYVIGWSDGGINALLLAIRHPDKVKKLAVTGANLWPDTTSLDPGLFHGLENQVKSLKKMAMTVELKNKLKLTQLMLNQPHITQEQLAKIECPSLIIGGDHDLIQPKHTLYIAQSIPGAFLWILPNSGHDTLIRYKDMFNVLVDNFFDM